MRITASLRFTLRPVLAVGMLLSAAAFAATAGVKAAPEVHTIGVLSPRSPEQTRSAFQPTADYLGRAIPGHRFEVLPLDLTEMNSAVADRRVSFVLTNPEHYVVLDARYSVTRIATLVARSQEFPLNEFGGLIFTRADRRRLDTLADLKGRTIAAVDPKAFGGYLMQAGELLAAGIDPESDMTVEFLGLPQDKIVQAVAEGRADAGFVRTGVLEAMAQEGKIRRDDFRPVAPRSGRNFPFWLSTALYPEWPFAVVRDGPEALAKQVAIALLAMPSDSDAARRGNYHGWSIPLSYEPVHELMKRLRVAPYDAPIVFDVHDVLRKYDIQVIALLMLVLAALAFFSSRFARLNRALSGQVALVAQHSRDLEAEVAVRTRAERRLADENRILELLVQSTPLPDLLQAIVAMAEAEHPGLPVAILLYDAARRRFLLSAHRNLSEICRSHLACNGIVSDDGLLPERDFARHFLGHSSQRALQERLLAPGGATLGRLIAFPQGGELGPSRSHLLGLAGLAGIAVESARTAEGLRLAGAVFDNALEGIVVTDPRGTVVAVNDAFCELTGYPREEIVGNNPRILQSGRQDKDFYRAMWQTLVATGRWRGEIWNRRRNGDIYPEILQLSSVRDPEGKLTHYVGTFSDITDLKKVQAHLEHLASYDSLTGLPNRALLTDRLNQALAHARRRQCLLGVCFLDLDNFKPVNDSYGHEIGDKLLHEVGQRLARAVRSGDTVARLGGDEFVLLITDLDARDEIFPSISRVMNQVSAPYLIDGYPLEVSTSIGVTLFPQDDADPDTLLRHADQAMYRAKQEGRNRYSLFDPQQDAQHQAALRQRQELQNALVEGQLRLHYQPKVDLGEGSVMGVEALLRWQHPQRGLLTPLQFLPAVEYDDLICEIGEWVLHEALRQLEIWYAHGHRFTMAVNIASRHFLKPNFIPRLEAILAAYPSLPPQSLELEILETAALEDVDQMLDLIRLCQATGVRFALDDFGTGYSSLTYLRRLPADTLKIDRSFVHGILGSREGLVLVEAVVGLASAFQCSVVAEGIETEEQGTMLLRIGCKVGQGYAIARPMPAADLPAWLASYRAPQAWKAWLDINWNTHDYPLIAAELGHRQWIDDLLAAVDGRHAPPPPPQLHDPGRCEFGLWFHHQGRARYGHAERYGQIDALHNEIHDLGRRLAALIESGERDAARRLAAPLREKSDRLLALLGSLQLAAAGEPPRHASLG